MPASTLNHDGRYAPSPTGALHLGNLRTAVVAWLFARSQRSRFVLRIEDLDAARVMSGMAEQQLDDLEAIGLTWDDTPLVQSHRLDVYRSAINQLAAQGQTYRCFCSRADIQSAASAPHGPTPDGAYPGTCRDLDEDTTSMRLERGDSHCIRLAADGSHVTFTDRILGPVSACVDDIVLMRRDGVFAYNLAAVVDDAAQGVGEVVRGDDLAPGTPRQLWLAAALGIDCPHSYAHIPLVLGPDGRRLAKRHRDATLADWTAAGRTGADLRAWIARSLQLAAPGESPSLDTMLERFDPELIPHDPVVVD